MKAFCDNAAVVFILNSRYCQDKTMMQMLRCLFFIEAFFDYKLSACHIAGQHNDLADDLSRDRQADFLKKKRDARPIPTNIPISFLQWLLHPTMEWTSPAWMKQFTTFVRKE